jgi:hypothetical protein
MPNLVLKEIYILINIKRDIHRYKPRRNGSYNKLKKLSKDDYIIEDVIVNSNEEFNLRLDLSAFEYSIIVY